MFLGQNHVTYLFQNLSQSVRITILSRLRSMVVKLATKKKLNPAICVHAVSQTYVK